MTDEAPLPLPEEKTWPPREGMRFFLLWSAGVLATAVVGRAMHFVSPNWTPNDRGLQVVWLLISVAAASWQAWLLFPVRGRFFAWVAGGVSVMGFYIWLLSAGRFGWMQASTLISAGLQIALLVGVRRRPWLLLPAALFEWLLNSAGIPWLYAYADKWSDWLAARLPAGISSYDILSSASSGLWLLGNLATAAVLAWWMPPRTGISRK